MSRLLRALDLVERLGNRLPAPLTIFALLAALVVIASWLAALAGVSVVHPSTGETIRAVNLLSAEGARRMLGEAVKNFVEFPPLGTVLVVLIGVGVAEKSGLVAAVLRGMVLAVPRQLLTAALVFAGVVASVAADAGLVLLPPLGAVLFAGVGRHPLAGLAAAFAGVSGGFAANVVLTSLDPLLAGITEPAARLVDPSYVVRPTANYFFMAASSVLLTVVGTWVTGRFVEKRLGTWEGAAPTLAAPEKRERRALFAAGVTAVAVLALIALLAATVLGEQAFFKALVPLLMIAFLVPGLVYGAAAGTIRSDKDVARMTGETLGTMGSYLVLAFMAAQLVAYFAWSKLGIILALQGARGLRAVGLDGIALIVGFVALCAVLNLLVVSSSALWALLAPVFVPMLMLMGWPPEATQAAYRVADSATNIITPLNPYVPIVLAFAQKYDRRAGLGTIISAMLPYSVAFGLSWTALLVVWLLAGIPLGF